MNTFTIYEDYVNELSELEILRREYSLVDTAELARTRLQDKIRESQYRLTRIMTDMINHFPYLDTKRTGQGILNE